VWCECGDDCCSHGKTGENKKVISSHSLVQIVEFISRLKNVGKTVNTSYVERFNLTLRRCLCSLEAVMQLLLPLKISLLFGFKALFAFLFLPFLNYWTASTRQLEMNPKEPKLMDKLEKGLCILNTMEVHDLDGRSIEFTM
jgi:hypothetical protein